MITFMERAAWLYRRESRKQTELFCEAWVSGKGFKNTRSTQIWFWAINRWPRDFSMMEYQCREQEDNER